MELQKIAVKIFTEPPDRTALGKFIEVFHRWIQATDGVYHDVADYSHMHSGPGIVLVAPHANLSIDESENRRGLVFAQKVLLSGSNQEKLMAALRAALENCRKLEEDRSLNPPIRFSGSEVLLAVNDRLVAPNREEVFDEIKPDIEAMAGRLFAGASFELKRDGDPRKRFNVTIATARKLDVQNLLENLKTSDGARAQI
jgi:hypothetical protein